MPLRVLYLHSSAKFGGSSKSLIEMFKALPGGEVEGTILCPRGQAADAFRDAGMRVVGVRGVSQWDETLYGHYRGLRWLVLLRELLLLPSTLLGLWRVRRLGRFDLIHANEINLAYLGGLASRWSKVPLVVHVRCVMRGEAGDARTRHVEHYLQRRAAAVIAIDETVRRSMPDRLQVDVVHNGMDVSGSDAAPRLRQPGDRLRVAIIGLLIRPKGVYEFVEAARLCTEAGIDAEYWIVGENVRPLTGISGWLLKRLGLSLDVRADLDAFIARHGLGDRVLFKGFVRDVRQVYRDIDLLCFVSYYDAPGRPVFEAALFGKPSIVCVRNPTPDTVIDGETGICLDTPDPRRIADAIATIAASPEAAVRMGANGLALARQNFDIRRNAARVLGIYRRVTGRA
jgi:glycosyltransferase involved in cell wall biosynthesis